MLLINLAISLFSIIKRKALEMLQFQLLIKNVCLGLKYST